MALRNSHARVLASEMEKETQAEHVRSFFEESKGGQSTLVAPSQHHTQQEHPHSAKDSSTDGAAKAKLMFDPPEEPRYTGPETLDPANRLSLISRADTLSKRAANISIKEATSQEKRKATEEAAYVSFEELRAQQAEIFELKRKMELEKHDSNYAQIHTLLFGPKPDDCGSLVDWDVYNKIQQQIRKFAYKRNSQENKALDETTQQLQERLGQQRDQLESQRLRIKELTASLRTASHEVASATALLAEKTEELTAVKQKNLVLMSQIKHLKENPAAAAGRRQSYLPSPLPHTPSGPTTPPQELLADFEVLVAANLRLEQENMLLRAKMASRGVDLQELRSMLPGEGGEGQAASKATDLTDKRKRRDFLKNFLPSSSAVLQLKQARSQWQLRQQSVSCEALAAFDVDANIELVRKPQFDLRRKQQPTVAPARAGIVVRTAAAPAVRRNAPGGESKSSNPSDNAQTQSQAAAQPDSTVNHGSFDDGDNGNEAADGYSDAPHSAIWQSLKVRMLGAVAVSRADCMRREAVHLQKMRHKIAALAETVAKLTSERDAAIQTCEKTQLELAEAKQSVTELVARCDKLDAIFNEAEEAKHRAVLEQRFKTSSGVLKTLGNRSARSAAAADGSGGAAAMKNENYEVLYHATQEKLQTLNDVLSTKIFDLEEELRETKEQLHATQAKLIRDGVFYNSKPLQSADREASPQSHARQGAGSENASKSRRFAELVSDEQGTERQSVRNALNSSLNVDDDDVRSDSPVQSVLVSRAPPAIDTTQEVSQRLLLAQQELAAAKARNLRQDKLLQAARSKLQVSEEQLALLRGLQQSPALSEKAAQLAFPALMRSLRRARTRIAEREEAARREREEEDSTMYSQEDGIQQSSTASGTREVYSDEDTQIIESMRLFVKAGSSADTIILRQKELRQRVETYAAAAIGAQRLTAPSAVVDLRILWLQLISLRESQLRMCTTAASRNILSGLLRETYRGLLECEEVCSSAEGDAVGCEAAKMYWESRQTTASSAVGGASKIATVASELADLRSSEQLEREKQAQQELKRSLLQLARDIEVKRSEYAAADSEVAEVALTAADTNKSEGVYFTVVPQPNSTLADVAAIFGVDPRALLDTASTPSISAPDGLNGKTIKVPLPSASALMTLAATYSEAVVYARYLPGPADTLLSIAARFGVEPAAIVAAASRVTLVDVPDDDLPLTVDVRLGVAGLADVSKRTDWCQWFAESRVVLFAEVVCATSSLRVFIRGLNINDRLVGVFNSLLTADKRQFLPVHVTANHVRRSVMQRWASSDMLCLRFLVTRRDTRTTIALRYHVAESDVIGEVREGSTVTVFLRSMGVLQSVLSCPAMSLPVAKRRTIRISTPTTLAQLSASGHWSRFCALVPNSDVPRFWKGPLECLIPLRSKEQLQFAVSMGASMMGIERVDPVTVREHAIASFDHALQLLSTQCDEVYAIEAIGASAAQRWDRSATARKWNVAHEEDILLWNAPLDPACCPTIIVEEGGLWEPKYDAFCVSFPVSSPYLRSAKGDEERLTNLARSLQQDVIEIVSFACPVQDLKCCEVPFFDAAAGRIEVRVFTATKEAAEAVLKLIRDDGAVSVLTHLTTALLDYNVVVDPSNPLTLSAVPQGSAGSAAATATSDSQCVVPTRMSANAWTHTVNAGETLLSVALKYQTRVTSILALNGATWLRRATAETEGRKARRKVQVGDDATAPSSSASSPPYPLVFDSPLRKLQINTLLIPTSVVLHRPLHATVFSDETHVSVAQFASQRGTRPDHVFVHPSELTVNVGSVLKIPAQCPKKYPLIRNVVGTVSDGLHFLVEGSGDTVSSICERFDVDPRVLMMENALMVHVGPGAVLTILPSTSRPPKFVVEHVLGESDTIASLCEQYNVAPQEILRSNMTLVTLPAADGLLVPVDESDSEELLSQKFQNLFTAVAEMPDTMIARAFSCSVEEIQRINDMASLVGRRIVPITSASSIALARRQGLPLFTAVGMNPSESLLQISERCGCHIGDMIRVGRQLTSLCSTLTMVRVPVSADVAAMRSKDMAPSSGRCLLEDVDWSIARPDQSKPAPRVIALTSSEAVAEVRDKLVSHAHKRSRFTQKMHFFDDKFTEVSSRIAAVQRELSVVEMAIEKQRATGDYVENEIIANRESVGVQTEAIMEVMPVELLKAAIRVPHHERSSQTLLTGEAVQETLSSISEAQGKELLLEVELQESRAEVKKLTNMCGRLSAELSTAKDAATRSETRAQAFSLQVEELERGLATLRRSTLSSVGTPRLPPKKQPGGGGDNDAATTTNGFSNSTPMTAGEGSVPTVSISSRRESAEDLNHQKVIAGQSVVSPLTLEMQRPSSIPQLKSDTQLTDPASQSANSSTNPAKLVDIAAQSLSQSASGTVRDTGAQCTVATRDMHTQTLAPLSPQPPTLSVKPFPFDASSPSSSNPTPRTRDPTTQGGSSNLDVALPSPQPRVSAVEFQQYNRLVHVADHSARDNQLAPKDSNVPMAIVFTDIQSSTSLWNRHPEDMAFAVEQHHELIRKLLTEHRGYEVKTIGDSFMVAFSSLTDATSFGLNLQTEFFNAPWPDTIADTYRELAEESGSVLQQDRSLWNGLRVRVGLNWGQCNARLDPVSHGYDYYGTTVNTAARVEGIGNGGQVLLTSSAMDELRTAHADFLKTFWMEDLGPQHLRGLDEPIGIYQVTPLNLRLRVYAELRVERGNEMSDEALVASMNAQAAALTEAEARARKAELAAAKLASDANERTAEAESRRRQSEAGFAAQLELHRRASVQSLDQLARLQDAAEKLRNKAEMQPLTTDSRPTGPRSVVSETSVRRRLSVTQELMMASVQRITTKYRMEVTAVKQACDEAMRRQWEFTVSLFRQLMEYLNRTFEERLVQKVGSVADEIASQVRKAVIEEKVAVLTGGAAEPKAVEPQDSPAVLDKRFAIEEITRHTTKLLSSLSTAPGTGQPSASNAQPIDAVTPVDALHVTEVSRDASPPAPPVEKPAPFQPPAVLGPAVPLPPAASRQQAAVVPIRRAVVSTIMNVADTKMRQSAPMTAPSDLQRRPTPPPNDGALPRRPLMPLPLERTEAAQSVDMRVVKSAADATALKSVLAKTLLNKDVDRIPTPPFETPFMPSVGATVGTSTVTHDAAHQLKIIKEHVHDEVLSALRFELPTSHRGAAFALSSLQTLNEQADLLPAQTDAVRRFREEQLALRRQKHLRMLRRIATRYRTVRVLESMSSRGGDPDIVRAMWRNWQVNWEKEHRQLIALERDNIERLLAQLGDARFEPSQPRRDATTSYVMSPFHAFHYVSPRNPALFRSARTEPILQPTAPNTAASSGHFRFAKF